MRSEYGYSKYNGDLFSGNNISEYDGSIIDEYDTFVLRDCGNDHKFSRIRDKLIQGLVKERSFATQAMEPCIVFIDGEFWGHYEITERLSDDYIESHFGVDESNVILIKNGELEDGEEGDEEEFSEFSEWIRETDFTDPANYEELESRVDLREFAEYMSVQFYIYNYDLSDQNLAVWKARTPDPDNTYADGKWRFILFDTEYSSGIYGQAIYSGNSFKDLEKKECLPRYLFYGAMENKDFRDIDAPTDVLSFPMIEYDFPEDFSKLEDESIDCFNQDNGELLLGDIILNVDRIKSQSEEFNHSIYRELAFLTAHSMLHLFGHDHIDEEQRVIMEEKQEEILNMKGYTRDYEEK